MKKTPNPNSELISPEMEIMQIVTPLTRAYKEILQNAFPTSQEKDLKAIKAFSELIRLTREESAILVMLYVKQESKTNINLKELALFLGPILMVTHRMIRTEIRHLMSLGLIVTTHYEDAQNMHLSSEAMQAIDKGDLHYFWNIGPNGIERMMEYVYENIFETQRVTSYKLGETFDEIESKNPDLKVIKYIQSLLMFAVPEELYTFLGTLTQGFLFGSEFSFHHTEDALHASITKKMNLKSSILQETWDPIVDGYIEIAGGGMQEGTPELRITDKGFDTFFGELSPEKIAKIRSKKKTIQTPLIQPMSIESTDLFFSEELDQQLNRISQVLETDRFNQYRALVSGKMKGLTMLFYGPPGSGKTEFVLQLAKETHRPLMKIQVSDILDKWVGESERNIKKIFKDYYKAMELFDVEPILFFNEADQLISKRLKVRQGNDQMLNGIQNLLLEEMENFKGILIGTTNLETEMDAAFERRWVVKVNFENPDETAQTKIWHKLFKELNAFEIKRLVSEYQLNPGEIQNVAKRWNMELLLGFSEEPFQVIYKLCAAERLNGNRKSGVIGFGAQFEPLQKRRMQNNG